MVECLPGCNYTEVMIFSYAVDPVGNVCSAWTISSRRLCSATVVRLRHGPAQATTLQAVTP